jgi:hypothetical protein
VGRKGRECWGHEEPLLAAVDKGVKRGSGHIY